MEKPYRYIKKLVRLGYSNYVIIPANYKVSKEIFRTNLVTVEIYKDKIVITPCK